MNNTQAFRIPVQGYCTERRSGFGCETESGKGCATLCASQ